MTDAWIGGEMYYLFLFATEYNVGIMVLQWHELQYHDDSNAS